MSRQPLLLLPGLLNDAELWRDQAAGLADIADVQVGDITRGDSLEALARDVLAAAPPSFALAGFSMGGYVAQQIARQAPERVARLALLDTSIHADTPQRAAERRMLDRSARQPRRFHGFGDRLLERYLDPAHVSDGEMVARVRGMTERLGVEVFLRQNQVVRSDGADLLRNWRKPLLILVGEHDQITPPAWHEEMAQIAPHARLVIVPQSGHLTPIEQPQIVTDALRGWLAQEV